MIEVIRQPRDKAESKYNPDVKLTKADEERYEKLLAENEELLQLIRAVSTHTYFTYPVPEAWEHGVKYVLIFIFL